ncbi:MAG: 2-succinyl-5-enolpyruvyl-6-hydroxy-3-cyclohexene-1-carboxylic-acid synthase [Halodesulfurarchaeum sp.]
MTNPSTRWAEIIVGEVAAAGVSRIVLAPGSRSTPLTVAADRHDSIETDTHLDERSAGFYAVGYGKRSGEPAALISTSGTAAVNFHPAVVEANQSRTPLLLLTADRPPELQDSGANQTIDQDGLYGEATRFQRTLQPPVGADRSLRSLRTTVARAVAAARGPHPGPVHLNVPFRKPLAPIETDSAERVQPPVSRGSSGRDEAYVSIHRGTVTPSQAVVEELEVAIGTADRGLVVVGPRNPDRADEFAIASFARRTGFPLVADPLSQVRFGKHVDDVTVVGGYDAYVDRVDWFDPDLIIRLGASPTSKPLRTALAESDARQFLVDPAGGWREATFTATDLVESAARPLLNTLAAADAEKNSNWVDRFERAERAHWSALEASPTDWEGAIAAHVLAGAPDRSTVFVSNSMPVRDLDRYGRPRASEFTVLGNRGASGIDGITSTALGAGSVTDDPLVLLIGDLAYFHDMNGLLALGRFGVEATIVLVNNDGGGIFHGLAISSFDPPFERQFLTPHGLDFSATADLYQLEFDRADPDELADAVRESTGRAGTQLLEVRTDGARSHEIREELANRVLEELT